MSAILGGRPQEAVHILETVVGYYPNAKSFLGKSEVMFSYLEVTIFVYRVSQKTEPTFKNSWHQHYFTDSNDSSSS